MRHGFHVFVYAAFVLGALLHVFKRATMSSLGKTPGKSLLGYIGKYWNIVLVRTVIAFCLFVAWVDHPQFVDTLIEKYLKADIDIALPKTKLVGFSLGFLSDSLLDFAAQKMPLPAWAKDWIQREVPVIPEQETVLTVSKTTLTVSQPKAEQAPTVP